MTTHGKNDKHNTYKEQHFGVHHAQSINHHDSIYTDTIIALIKAFLLELLFSTSNNNQNKIYVRNQCIFISFNTYLKDQLLCRGSCVERFDFILSRAFQLWQTKVIERAITKVTLQTFPLYPSLVF